VNDHTISNNNSVNTDIEIEMSIRRQKIISARQLLVDLTPTILWRESNDLLTKLLILHLLQISAGVSDADVLTTRRLFARESNGLLDRQTQILVHQQVVAMSDALRKQIAWDLDCAVAVRQRGQEILAFSGTTMQPAQRQQLFDAMLETALNAANSNISSQAPVAFDRSAPLFHSSIDNIHSLAANRPAPFQGQSQRHGHRQQLSSLLQLGQPFHDQDGLPNYSNSQGLRTCLSTLNGNDYNPSTQFNNRLSGHGNSNESNSAAIDSVAESRLNLLLAQLQQEQQHPPLDGNLLFAIANSGHNLARRNEHHADVGHMRNLHSILQSSPALGSDILRADPSLYRSISSAADLQFQLQQQLSFQVQMQEQRFGSRNEHPLQQLRQQLLEQSLLEQQSVERNGNRGNDEVSSYYVDGEVVAQRQEQGQWQGEGGEIGREAGRADQLQDQDYEDEDGEEDIADEEEALADGSVQAAENARNHASRWRTRYEELLQYREEFGDCLVSCSFYSSRIRLISRLTLWFRCSRLLLTGSSEIQEKP